MKRLLLLLTCIASFEGFGQETVLKMPKSVLDEDYSYGKNNKHYVHVGLSVFVGISAVDLPALQFSSLNSSGIHFFLLYKRNLNSIFSLTSEFSFGTSQVQYTYNGVTPIFPTVFSEHRRDVISTGEFELRQNIRIRLSGGPNSVGNYLEAGVIGGISSRRNYIHRGVSLENQRTELMFINSPVTLADGNSYALSLFYYGFKGRIGFNRLSIPFRFVQNGDFWWMMTGVEYSLF